MNEKNLVMTDIAYHYIRKSKLRSTTFNRLWAYVARVKGFGPQEEDNNIAEFHLGLLQDKRMMLSPKNGNWALREDFKYDQYKKSTAKTSVVMGLLDLDEVEEDITEEEEMIDFTKVFNKDE